MIIISILCNRIQKGNFNNVHGSSAVNIAQLPQKTVGHKNMVDIKDTQYPLMYCKYGRLISKTDTHMSA